MREIFFATLARYKENAEEFTIPYHPIDLHNHLRDIAATEFCDALYKDQIVYTASIMKKVTKLYKECFSVLYDPLVSRIKSAALEPEIPEFDEIYSSDLLKSEDEVMENLVILTHIYKTEIP